MRTMSRICMLTLLLAGGVALADSYDDAISAFMAAGQSGSYFEKSYGYAVFPTVGKAGFGVGAAHGKGKVYEKGKYIGDTSVTQLSAGLQIGAQAYSEILFFKDKRALDEFKSGNFEVGADMGVTVITASASAGTGTQGSTAGASGSHKEAVTAGGWHKGIAIFAITKGGAMAAAAVQGQKFSYKPSELASSSESEQR